MKKVLFILPSSRKHYAKAKVKVGIPERPSLTFATLAAPLLQAGHEVEVLDLNIAARPDAELAKKLDEFSPDYVGITCTTPLVQNVRNMASVAKQHNADTVVVVGGAHPSSLPESTMAGSDIDIVCVGEGDFTITEIVGGADLSSIRGIHYMKDGVPVANPSRELIADLDRLPMPVWSLFDLSRYRTPRLTCRANPVGTLETSRGCVYGCTYCNKNVFGRTCRMKSPQRVVDEIEYMIEAGFRDIHIMDDGFTTDLKRAKQICDLIVERGLKVPWNLHNGIRVNRVDKEFLEKARDAGCYSVTFGIESGDQTILDNIHKGTTLEQARQAFAWTKEVGIETLAFFMLGLPGETEVTLQKTIDFAKELDPDYTKASILLPLPGTPLYGQFEQEGRIRSKDWSLYNQDDPSGVYDHDNLSWETINHYYRRFYRQFYLRPHAVWKQLKKNAFSTNLFYDLTYALKTRW